MRKGFSFIEVVIVVAIASSIVLVVGGLSNNTNVLNNLVSQELQSKSNINQTLQIMTSEMRSATTAANGAFAINAASTSSLSFYADINKNGIIERVRYFISSSSIYKGVIQPTGTPAVYATSSESLLDIIDNVIIPASSSLFSYYDSSYTGAQSAMTSTANLQNIRLVGISFSVDVKPQQAPAPQPFSAFVDIRSLRSN